MVGWLQGNVHKPRGTAEAVTHICICIYIHTSFFFAPSLSLSLRLRLPKHSGNTLPVGSKSRSHLGMAFGFRCHRHVTNRPLAVVLRASVIQIAFPGLAHFSGIVAKTWAGRTVLPLGLSCAFSSRVHLCFAVFQMVLPLRSRTRAVFPEVLECFWRSWSACQVCYRFFPCVI